MQIKPLSQATLSSAIQLANLVFPRQNLLEKASFAFRLSLMSGWLPKLLLSLMSIDEARYWVALNEDGEAIGVTGLYKYIKDEDNSLWLGWTCVVPTARGKGIGGKLVDFAIAQTISEGKKFLRLYTSNDPNESAAQHLYERKGLRVVGEKKLQGSPFKRIYRELSLTHCASESSPIKGQTGNSEKSDAKCENIAHIDNKCTLIMAKVIASEIKGKH